MRILSIFLSAVILVGCAASGPVFTAAPNPDISQNQSLIYIYRENTMAFGGREASFYLDGKDIGDLSRDGYTWFKASAGTHRISQNWAWDILFGMKINITSEWEPGHTYFYKFTTTGDSNGAGMTLRWRLMQVRPDIAMSEIASAKYQPAKSPEFIQ